MSALYTTPEENAKPFLLGRHPWLGFILVVVGLALFYYIAVQVRTNGPLTQWDNPAVQALNRQAAAAPPLIVKMMIGMAALGREMVFMLSIILGLYFFNTRHYKEVVMIAIAVIGGEVLFELLSRGFARHRPVLPHPIEVLPGPGFPSGHSISAVLMYGLIAYLFVPQLSTTLKKVLLAAAMVLIIAMIGFSRVWVGDHYPTDVLAGLAIGLAWGALVYTLVDWIFWRVYRLRHPAFSPLKET